MAKLLSEDTDCPSSLTLTPGEIKILAEQKWQSVDVEVQSGKRSLKTMADEDSCLCRAPSDEVTQLLAKLKALLERHQAEVLFEPAEPSFELSFARTRRDGIKVEAWLDAGNGTTAIYTWDAAGIRFYTTDEHLMQFVHELEKDFTLL